MSPHLHLAAAGFFLPASPRNQGFGLAAEGGFSAVTGFRSPQSAPSHLAFIVICMTLVMPLRADEVRVLTV